MSLKAWEANGWIRGHEPTRDPVLVDTLDAIRRKRNISNYDRAGVSSPTEAEQVYRISVELRTRVVEWLRVRHPHLAEDT
jgi:hypothetical protein